MKTKTNNKFAICNLQFAISFFVFFVLFRFSLISQNIGINTTGSAANSSALLEVGEAANLIAGGDTKGFLCPHVSLASTTDVTTIATPANGLIVYNTNAAMLNGNGVGLYFYCSSGCTTVGWKFMAAPDNGPGTSGQVLTSQGPAAQAKWTTPVATTGGGGSTGCASCITAISSSTTTTGTWTGCANYCNTLAGGPWHMPTWDEAVYYRTALSLSGPWIASYVWTSTPWDTRVAAAASTGTWVVFGESDGDWSSHSSSDTNYCRCVK